jgi:hypothetical protein
MKTILGVLALRVGGVAAFAQTASTNKMGSRQKILRASLIRAASLWA